MLLLDKNRSCNPEPNLIVKRLQKTTYHLKKGKMGKGKNIFCVFFLHPMRDGKLK